MFVYNIDFVPSARCSVTQQCWHHYHELYRVQDFQITLFQLRDADLPVCNTRRE